MVRWRHFLRRFLIGLLKLIDQRARERKKRKRISLREARVSPRLVGVAIFLILFWILLGEFGFSWENVLGLLLFIGIILVLLSVYMKRYIPDTGDHTSLAIIGLITIIMVLLIEVIHVTPELSSYLVPVASAGMLITILINSHLAMVVVLLLSIITALINRFNFDLFFFALVGGVAGICSSLDVRHRRDLVRAGLYISGANMVIILMIGLMKQKSFSQLGENFLWGIGNGFLCVILTMGILPYLEELFSITTNIKLLELSDFNQPLLKRLMVEAPGTYHHSIIVGNLVENASELIGANSLLARVGAYYHDIGKLKNAEYFSENQEGLLSKHDDLTSSMSSLILISHVKEGVDIAREYKLHRPIINIIEQHHGTSLIYYFYHRALEENKVSKVGEEKYRYPGPKPRTKEVAIVMLADAVEATSRTLEQPSYERLKNMVDKVINDKFIDGQLNDCNITLVNLHRIAESFAHTLTGIYHTRVEYPKKE
ncbi:MAG: HD family phosphohydrolase [bacterium]